MAARRHFVAKRTPTGRAAGACLASCAGLASLNPDVSLTTSVLQDFIPTFAAAAGEPNLVEKVKKGYKIGNTTFKVHLDGYNLLPFLAGKEKESPRKGFLYWSDDGDLMALRGYQYKIVFAEQRSKGLDVWREPLSPLRVPKIFDLRSDPFERGEESIS